MSGAADAGSVDAAAEDWLSAARQEQRSTWRDLFGDAGCALPPPVLRDPLSECPRLDAPFVTDDCGALPMGPPDGLEQTLEAYLPARSREEAGFEPPEVGTDGSGKQVASWLNVEGVAPEP